MSGERIRCLFWFDDTDNTGRKYCMTHICCGTLFDEPHAEDCGGLVVKMDE